MKWARWMLGVCAVASACGQVNTIRNVREADGAFVERIRDELMPDEGQLRAGADAYLMLRVLGGFEPDLQIALQCRSGSGCRRIETRFSSNLGEVVQEAARGLKDFAGVPAEVKRRMQVRTKERAISEAEYRETEQRLIRAVEASLAQLREDLAREEHGVIRVVLDGTDYELRRWRFGAPQSYLRYSHYTGRRLRPAPQAAEALDPFVRAAIEFAGAE